MKKKIFHIVAVSEGRIIGKENRLPWHFSVDLRRFKKLTLGSTVLMGRKTFESIGQPLGDRINFVLSRSNSQNLPSLRYFKSIEEALENIETENCFIIGGASLYEQTIREVDGIYLTRIHAHYEGDAFYPKIPGSFRQMSREITEEKGVKLEFLYLENGEKQ